MRQAGTIEQPLSFAEMMAGIAHGGLLRAPEAERRIEQAEPDRKRE